MPFPVRHTAARRDASLLRLRKLSLWIAGGASGAALGLGLTFAHAAPGHAAGTGQRAGSAGNGQQATGNARPAGSAAPRAGQRPHHHRKLAVPHHAPAPSSAPSVVTSGGS
jgi:hypothetical protein